MKSPSDELTNLAKDLHTAAMGQIAALQKQDMAALERAVNRFAALSSRWEAQAAFMSDLPSQMREELQTHLQAAAEALREAQALGRQQLQQLSQNLGEAPQQRERLIAYTRAMNNQKAAPSNSAKLDKL